MQSNVSSLVHSAHDLIVAYLGIFQLPLKRLAHFKSQLSLKMFTLHSVSNPESYSIYKTSQACDHIFLL